MSVENLVLKPENDTPGINFDASSGEFEINGMSRPEDVTKVYNPIIEWIEKYSQSPANSTVVNFRYAYFNTASARKIYELLAVFDNLNSSGKTTVTINWYYDEPDIDMRMAGEEYDELIDIDINHISVALD